MRKDKTLSSAFRVSVFRLATTLSGGTWALLAMLALVSGCVTTTVQTSLSDRISSSLLTCRERPDPGPVPRQSDVARFIVESDLAGEDCRRKLGAVRSIVEADNPNSVPKAN